MDGGSPRDTVQNAWRFVTDPTALAKSFFNVLFTQHASLKRKLFADVNLAVAEPAFGKLLSQAISGQLTSSEIRALSKEHAATRSLENKHVHYFLTAMLTALGMTIGSEQFTPTVADAFRVLLTKIGDDVLVGAGMKAVEDVPAAESETLATVWAGLGPAGRSDLIADFIKAITTQHPTVKKRFLSETDESKLKETLLTYADGVLTGATTTAALETLGADLSNLYPIEKKHFDYVYSSATYALSKRIPQYGKVTGPSWMAKLNHVLSCIREGAFAQRASEESFMVSSAFTEHGGGKRGSSIVNPKEAMAAFSSMPPFDVVRECWTLLQDKPAIITRFYTVLLTQHSTLLEGVLAGVDLEALVPVIEEWITDLVSGAKPVSALRELAVTQGVPRKCERRHLHYFHSAALTALSYSIGDTFPAVSQQWRLILDGFVDEAAAGLEAAKPVAAAGADIATTSSVSVSPHANKDDDADGKALTDDQCLQLARDSWKELGAAGKRGDVIQAFFTILFTQHPATKKTVFQGLDVANLAAPFEKALTEALESPTFPSLPAVAELAKQVGTGRGVEYRHFQYFLVTFLASLPLVIGRDAFKKVSEAWRVVLTAVMKECMTGCGISADPQ